MGANVYTQGFGSKPENVEVPFVADRAPTSSDIIYPLGKKWIHKDNGSYELIGLSSSGGTTTASWNQISTTVGPVLVVNGTANEISASLSAGTVTLTIPATFVAPGFITATVGNITASNGNLNLVTAGNKIEIATGANASVGQATLATGTVTVNTTAVTTNSLIFLTVASPAGTQGYLSVGTITDATSFVINSTSATETSVVNWFIIN